MRFGLEQRHWQIVEETIIAPLKKHGADVWVFGSRARGVQQKFSDLDILYSSALKPIKLSEVARMIEAVEKSNLPIKIDLVDEANLAQSYRSSVLNDRVKV